MENVAEKEIVAGGEKCQEVMEQVLTVKDQEPVEDWAKLPEIKWEAVSDRVAVVMLVAAEELVISKDRRKDKFKEVNYAKR